MAINFPSHDINPANKGQEWHLEYAKAAMDEYEHSGIKIGYNQRNKYKEIVDYVLGQQSTDKYKKNASIDGENDPSWITTDWSVRPVMAKLRDIWLSKLTQKGFNITATPIDILAKDETEKYYAEAKAKIMMRQAAMQVSPELAAAPAFIREPGEPEDLEELEMMMDIGVKLKVAMEAEMGVDYVFHKNNFKSLRRINLENWGDYGIGGYKEWVNENGDVCSRDIDPLGWMCSWCNRPDFKDGKYWGEVIEVPVGELPFDKDTRRKIAESVNNATGTWDRTGKYGDAWDKERVPVLDLEFITYNDRMYERRQNAAGNVITRRARWEKKFSESKTIINGKEESKYFNKPIQSLQKVKWVIGTDYVYDFGPATYQKREKPNKAITYSSYHAYAVNMKRMRTTSMVERLIPVIDEYHNTVYKIENFKAKWIPYVINIDLQAMETVALGKAGGNMTEKEILELVFENFVAMGRRMDVSGNLQNYKMVDIETTGMHQEYTVLAGDLARLLNEMRDMVGLNDLTDGSTPGERTLNYVASLGNEATNNALYPITWADRCTTESLAKGVLLRLVQTVQQKEVEGVTRTLGDETVKFIRVTKDIADRIWDVKIEDRPTDAQKEMLLQQLNIKDSQGLIGPEDVILITETYNLKQARVLLAHKVNRRRKEMEAAKQQEMLTNGQVQQQSAIVAEEEKRKTLAFEYELKTGFMEREKEKEKELLAMKLAGAKEVSDTSSNTKLITESMKTAQPAEAGGKE